jgi:hypothetical protein
MVLTSSFGWLQQSGSLCTLLATASVLPQKRLNISTLLILPLQTADTMPGW